MLRKDPFFQNLPIEDMKYGLNSKIWKSYHITPIDKKGNIHNSSDYMPISLVLMLVVQ